MRLWRGGMGCRLTGYSEMNACVMKPRALPFPPRAELAACITEQEYSSHPVGILVRA